MADDSQNTGQTPPEAGAERPLQGKESEKEQVIARVRSSLDSLKKQLPQGKELKDVIEKAPELPRSLLEAVAEAQRLGIDLLADPEIRRLNQELVEKLSPGDDATLRQWLLGVPAELQSLRSDVEAGKGKPQDALSSLGSEGGAMARVDLLTQPGGLLSLENVKKFAGSIPFLAKKDAQGNVLPMSDEQALAIQGTVLGFVKSWAAGLLEKFGVGAPEFRFEEEMRKVGNPVEYFSEKDLQFYNANKERVKSAWTRLYRRALARKEKGKPVVVPTIDDAIAELKGASKPPEQTPQAQKKLFGIEGMEPGKDFDPGDGLRPIEHPSEKVEISRTRIRVGDATYELFIGGSKVTKILYVPQEGKDISAVKVKAEINGAAKGEVPFGDLLAKVRESNRGAEVTVGQITLKKFEQKNG